MTYTENYNFELPDDNDQYNRDYYNNNFETIDTEVQRLIDIIEEVEG